MSQYEQDAALAAKMQQYDPHVVSAQPVTHTPAYAVGTVAAPPTYISAAPYGQQQQMVYVQANGAGMVNANGAPVQQRQRIIGRWADNICDWPSNLFPSCYCVCCVCCGMWIVAQMAQKAGCSSFRNIAWAWVLCAFIGMIITIATGGLWIFWIPMIFMFIVSLILRVHIAKKDQIQECGGPFGECCVGFWCWYCSVAQMARHIYGYTKVLDGDSDPERPDSYSPLVGGPQQV